MSDYHTPVLLEESVSAIVTDPSGVYADATFGGGGHSAAILSRLSPEGRLIAFDRDADALATGPMTAALHSYTTISDSFIISSYMRDTATASTASSQTLAYPRTSLTPRKGDFHSDMTPPWT